MKLTEHIYFVGSGAFGLSDPGDCHVYLLDGGDELALIDAGGGGAVEQIIENIRCDGLDLRKLRYILLTHSHGDHSKGCIKLKSILKKLCDTDLIIISSQAEARLLSKGTIEELGLDLMGLGEIPREQSFPRISVDRIVDDNEDIYIGNLRVRAIQVRGHNPGCMCYSVQMDGKKVMFSGDVILSGGVIILGNWAGTDLQAYRTDLKKLGNLGIDALLPGHLLWTINGGQAHIDKANQAFSGLFPPPNISQIP